MRPVPRRPTLGRAAALLLALAPAACTNQDARIGVLPTSAPPPGVEVSLSRDVQPIFNQSCATAFCHGGTLASPMSLEEDKAHGSLVGVPSCEAPGLKRVEPGSSELSYLIIKLEGRQSAVLDAGSCATCSVPLVGPVANCGTQMPPGQPPLDGHLIQLIRDWIDQGAENN